MGAVGKQWIRNLQTRSVGNVENRSLLKYKRKTNITIFTKITTSILKVSHKTVWSGSYTHTFQSMICCRIASQTSKKSQIKNGKIDKSLIKTSEKYTYIKKKNLKSNTNGVYGLLRFTAVKVYHLFKLRRTISY